MQVYVRVRRYERTPRSHQEVKTIPAPRPYATSAFGRKASSITMIISLAQSAAHFHPKTQEVFQGYSLDASSLPVNTCVRAVNVRQKRRMVSKEQVLNKFGLVKYILNSIFISYILYLFRKLVDY